MRLLPAVLALLCAASAAASFSPLGDSLFDSMVRVDVADVSANGNARHDDEWMSGLCFRLGVVRTMRDLRTK